MESRTDPRRCAPFIKCFAYSNHVPLYNLGCGIFFKISIRWAFECHGPGVFKTVIIFFLRTSLEYFYKKNSFEIPWPMAIKCPAKWISWSLWSKIQKKTPHPIAYTGSSNKNQTDMVKMSSAYVIFKKEQLSYFQTRKANHLVE